MTNMTIPHASGREPGRESEIRRKCTVSFLIFHPFPLDRLKRSGFDVLSLVFTFVLVKKQEVEAALLFYSCQNNSHHVLFLTTVQKVKSEENIML